MLGLEMQVRSVERGYRRVRVRVAKEEPKAIIRQSRIYTRGL